MRQAFFAGLGLVLGAFGAVAGALLPTAQLGIGAKFVVIGFSLMVMAFSIAESEKL